MNSFIIRIYREENDGARTIVGIVEDVEKQTKVGFRDFKELWNILMPDRKLPILRDKKS